MIMGIGKFQKFRHFVAKVLVLPWKYHVRVQKFLMSYKHSHSFCRCFFPSNMRHAPFGYHIPISSLSSCNLTEILKGVNRNLPRMNLSQKDELGTSSRCFPGFQIFEITPCCKVSPSECPYPFRTCDNKTLSKSFQRV